MEECYLSGSYRNSVRLRSTFIWRPLLALVAVDELSSYIKDEKYLDHPCECRVLKNDWPTETALTVVPDSHVCSNIVSVQYLSELTERFFFVLSYHLWC
jgi:hypothetical protein